MSKIDLFKDSKQVSSVHEEESFEQVEAVVGTKEEVVDVDVTQGNISDEVSPEVASDFNFDDNEDSLTHLVKNQKSEEKEESDNEKKSPTGKSEKQQFEFPENPISQQRDLKEAEAQKLIDEAKSYKCRVKSFNLSNPKEVEEYEALVNRLNIFPGKLHGSPVPASLHFFNDILTEDKDGNIRVTISWLEHKSEAENKDK